MRYFIIFAAMAVAFAGILTRVADQAGRTPSPQIAAASAVAAPAAPASSAGYRSITIPRDSRGHFQVDARADG